MNMKFTYTEINDTRCAILNNEYIIFETGKIYNIIKEDIITPRIVKNHYVVTIQVFGKNTTINVGRLVAEAFVDKPDTDKSLVVVHKDGNNFNNNYTNLMWLTREEHSSNILKSRDTPLKKTTKKVKLINNLECKEIEFDSLTDAAKYLISIDTSLNIHTVIPSLSIALKTHRKSYGWRVIEVEKSGN